MSQSQHAALEAVTSKISSAATYGGAGTTIGGGLISNDLAIVVGMAVGVLGLLLKWYYAVKEDRRRQAEHERQMGEMGAPDPADGCGHRASQPERRRPQKGRKSRGTARLPVILLSLSASALVGLAIREGYTDRAVIPVGGDRPTVGFGSTFRDDGAPVRMGDTITPSKAVARAHAHIQKDETRLKQCVTAPVSQTEYDLLVDHAYQYGVSATCSSSIVRHINAERYADACAAYLRWRFVAGRDCSVRANGCYGVWARSEARHRKCMEAL